MGAWDDVNVIAACISAIAAAGASVIAVSAARQSRVSAIQANQASTALLAIEQDRRHTEMIPQFQVEYQASGLLVTLLGPVGLDHLDDVTLRVRGNGPLTITSIQPFNRRPDGPGLNAHIGLLDVGGQVGFGLEPAAAPVGWEDGWNMLKGTSFQFTLAARHNTYGSWSLPGDIDIKNETAWTVNLPDDQPHPRR